MNTNQRTMSRRFALFLSLLFAVALWGCSAPKPTPNSLNQHQYAMDVSFDESAKTLSGTLDVTYHNPAGKKLTEADFMAYPNAYLKEETAPFEPGDMEKAFPNGFSQGELKIARVTVDGQPASFVFSNDDETRLTVSLPAALEAEESALIHFEFTVVLPNSLGRFGYGDKAFNLCNFYPVACVYEKGELISYPYYAMGDPFVSDMADYEVKVSVPKGMAIAHSGQGSVAPQGDREQYTITATNVRDFAMVLSRHWEVKEQQVKQDDTDTLVRTYTYKDAAYGKTQALEVAVESVKSFSKLIGRYPHSTLSIVQTDFFIGGMEYPGMVLIDKILYNEGYQVSFEHVIAHEVGHQWFYGEVGNDQVKEPWLDEALTDYITLCYIGDRYGEKMQDQYYLYMVVAQYNYINSTDHVPPEQMSVGLPSIDYDSGSIYSAVVYNRGTMMLNEVAQKVGQKKLLAALKVYFNEYAGRRAHKEDLLRILGEELGNDAVAIMKKYL